MFSEKSKVDFGAISSVIKDEFSPKKRAVQVWHCCTPGGTGYYMIKDDQKMRFARSVLTLPCIGAAWSPDVWQTLYKAQSSLNEYLTDIKEELEKSRNVTMVIRQLYLDFILEIGVIKRGSPAFVNQVRSRLDMIEGSYKTLPEYREKYAVEIADRIKHKSLFDYYNREGALYYKATYLIQEAVNKVHEMRPDLEKAGRWDQTYEYLSDVYQAAVKYCKK